ncbi:MAG TPA: endolytic transglycosylase MltG [Hyphomicrobiaceae bacterium]|nr:endolytic transglycosylase MltG [Hyphomicrobiaceae bacterium]
MRNRHPAARHADPNTTRTRGSLARSPAERLEPTRPPARVNRRPRVEAERVPRPLLAFMNGVLTVALVGMVLIGALAYYFDGQMDAPGPLERAKVVVIPKLEGSLEIAARLEREGVVSDRRLFTAGYRWLQFLAWLEGDRTLQLKAGDYELRPKASVRELVELLAEGKTVTYKVTVPEGLTSQQIVDRLMADGNLTGDITATPPEGVLLPETFVTQRGAQRQAVLEAMQAQAHKLMDRLWAQRKKDLPVKSWQEAVILASIVEKETGRNDERDRVAAVFLNRLRQNMRLQSDPTILYGLFGGKVAWGRPIQKTDIGQKTSHNTYQIDGLPPTPICNPGRRSIEAVLQPRETKELYFVADGNGGHVFAETLKDHNANVQKWRLVEKDLKAKAAPEPAAEEATAKMRPALKQRAAARARADMKAAPGSEPRPAPDNSPADAAPATAAAPAEPKRR